MYHIPTTFVHNQGRNSLKLTLNEKAGLSWKLGTKLSFPLASMARTQKGQAWHFALDARACTGREGMRRGYEKEGGYVRMRFRVNKGNEDKDKNRVISRDETK